MGWEMGGRFKRKETCVSLWLVHADAWQKPTQCCKAITLQLKINSLKNSKRFLAWVFHSGLLWHLPSEFNFSKHGARLLAISNDHKRQAFPILPLDFLASCVGPGFVISPWDAQKLIFNLKGVVLKGGLFIFPSKSGMSPLNHHFSSLASASQCSLIGSTWTA